VLIFLKIIILFYKIFRLTMRKQLIYFKFLNYLKIVI